MSKMIQLRSVPDALHRSLKARAAMAGCPTLVAFLRQGGDFDLGRLLASYGVSPMRSVSRNEREDFDLMQTSECKSRQREASQDQPPLQSPASFISRSITLRSALLIRVW